MKLLIDAGNTRIKWALAEGAWTGGAAELEGGALSVAHAQDLPQHFARLENVRQAWVSNVAGEAVARQIRAACAPLEPRFIVARGMQCGVRNGYADPAQLGSDRWAALIAAWHLTGGACLVVNSGTATTIDAMSANGEFIGGLILPGVELMQRSLCETAALLQESQARNDVHFPLNTADAILNGALQASCGAIDRQYALLGMQGAPIVLGGGAARVLQDRLNTPSRIVDNLVLHGLWLIAQEINAQ